MIPRFFVGARPGFFVQMFSRFPFAVYAEFDGTRKLVAVTHEAEIGQMLSTALNQYRELEAQLAEKPRIVTP